MPPVAKQLNSTQKHNMKRKYAYVFSIGCGKLVWSGEDAASLRRRARKDDEMDVEEFIEANKVGHFIQLSTGEMVFQIA